MQLWLDLLFGNPIGILSLVTVFGAIAVIAFIMRMVIRNAMAKEKR
jgi:hypothetical protein